MKKHILIFALCFAAFGAYASICPQVAEVKATQLNQVWQVCDAQGKHCQGYAAGGFAIFNQQHWTVLDGVHPKAATALQEGRTLLQSAREPTADHQNGATYCTYYEDYVANKFIVAFHADQLRYKQLFFEPLYN